MNTPDPSVPAHLRGYAPWLMALMMLAVLLVVSTGFGREFQRAEQREIERYFGAIVTHVETDLLGSAAMHASIQQRMARRLSFDGPFDEAAWRSDARGLIGDHPFYRALAVLEADFGVRWAEGRLPGAALSVGEDFPLSTRGRARLEASEPVIDTIVLEPLATTHGQATVVFATPIPAGEEITNWLVSVIDVPGAIESMLTGFYLREVVLSGRFAGIDFTIPAAEGLDDATNPFRQAVSFELGDTHSRLDIDVALRPEKVEEMRSALPELMLTTGTLSAVLFAATALLGMIAARQTRVLSSANRKLTGEIRERELAERELEFLLTHDSLTGLPNRQGMLRRIERALGEAAQDGCLALFYVDLDQFKDINETLGHHLGDELLRRIPERLARELDDVDVLGRLGGDEFLVLVHRRDHERVLRLGQHLLGALDKPFRIGEHELFITASIGVAMPSGDGVAAGELIQNADAALYRAKQLGRNQLAVFTPEMFARVEYRLNLSRDIRQAIDNDEFRLVYQPIVDLQTLELRGLEALLRWQHRDGYDVPPRDFIRVAEETGTVHRLSQCALARAVHDLADWQARFARAPWLAVNISGAQFREAGFAEELSVLLHQHRVAPQHLHLEITEEVLIENMERNRAMLARLNRIGMPIVVDDFGVGYSSLAYIKNFPVSTIKIDQGFVSGLQHDADDRAITRTICDLSRALSLATVAEGIEEPGQLELLRDYGCALGQGFLFMHPSPAQAIEPLLGGTLPWQSLIDALPEPCVPAGRGDRAG